ncbi:hypothetical protein NDU88_003147 [Pleurodeles waltl]|uniref:Uncharacterized protein n=1 Tax=Pleurodeles waltl TaxID=8319 RepID=A0AAV7UBQ9_PLEWA|nr:hypothetical protein NDU88_003147 [Pleurodeles waltl]
MLPVPLECFLCADSGPGDEQPRALHSDVPPPVPKRTAPRAAQRCAASRPGAALPVRCHCPGDVLARALPPVLVQRALPHCFCSSPAAFIRSPQGRIGASHS